MPPGARASGGSISPCDTATLVGIVTHGFAAGAPQAPDLDYSAVIATMLGEQPLP